MNTDRPPLKGGGGPPPPPPCTQCISTSWEGRPPPPSALLFEVAPHPPVHYMAKSEMEKYPHQRHEKKKCFCGKLSPGELYLFRHTLKNEHILVLDPKCVDVSVLKPKCTGVEEDLSLNALGGGGGPFYQCTRRWGGTFSLMHSGVGGSLN